MGFSDIPYLDWAWNPMTGCTRCATECANCWAFTMASRFHWDMTPRFHASALQEPLRWRCRSKGLVGVNFRSDLFHEAFTDEEVCQVLDVLAINEARPERYLALTKRPERLASGFAGYLPANMWVGFSSGCMETLERGWTHMSRISAPRRVLSAEPLIAPIRVPDDADWVIVGAESGAKRRACPWTWIASIVDQCRAKSIPCYVKRVSLGGQVSDDPKDWPESLRVQEFPADRPAPQP